MECIAREDETKTINSKVDNEDKENIVMTSGIIITIYLQWIILINKFVLLPKIMQSPAHSQMQSSAGPGKLSCENNMVPRKQASTNIIMSFWNSIIFSAKSNQENLRGRIFV